MMQPLPPGSTIGILGGGQLGRMLGLAAAQIGYKTHIFAPEADGVAREVASAWTVAAYDDEMALNAFCNAVDVVTFEFENVPVDTVKRLSEYVPVRPGAKSLELSQDRLKEKAFAQSCGVPLAPFAEVRSAADLAAAVAGIGTPAILKTATEGYDGKGQARVMTPDDAVAAWAGISERRAIYEAMVDFTGEFSVLLVRGLDGSVETWECPQNIHDDGILGRSLIPAGAALSKHCATAVDHALSMADALDHVGLLACEFFATDDGPLFNEMAPRVHNSGHWTIEGAVTSQFENHIRAICGLPLGAPTRIGSAVEMRNLIGPDIEQWADFMADPLCRLHLYGKGHGRAGRKMGHATWVRHGERA